MTSASDPIVIEEPAARIWTFANAELDDGKRSLVVAGQAVQLPPVPLMLLRVLLAAAPRVVPHNELLARVWHRPPELVSRNVLSNTVARLRAALGEAGQKPLEKVRGVGYCWRGPVHSRVLYASVDAVPAADSPESPQAEAERFIARLWMDMMRGHTAGHGEMTLNEAIQAGLDRASAELSAKPLVLACIHRALAANRRFNHDAEGAIHHLRAAWQSAAAPTGRPQPEVALEAHFELARTLATSVGWLGDPQRLAVARHELASARAELRHTPGASQAVRLSAARATFLLSFYEQDWPHALAASRRVIRRTDALSNPDPRHLWECRIHHAAVLMRAGERAASLDEIDALFDRPPARLDAGDMMLLQARAMRGTIHACLGQHADAVKHLEPLHAELAGSGRLNSSVGQETGTWLAHSMLHVGRAAEALPIARAMHAMTAERLGRSAEATLETLAVLARACLACGEGREVLPAFEADLRPLLPQLAMPGRRYAILALAEWIETLDGLGEREAAAQLATCLRPEDLHAAVLQPAEAQAFWLRFGEGRTAAAAVQGIVARE